MEFWAPLNEGTTSVAPDDLINHRTGTHSGSGNAMSRTGLGSSQCSSSSCDHCITVEYLETAGAYRYGFNGKEQDEEMYSEGNAYDFGARIYNARVGRWMSVDPQSDRGASFSPFMFGLNNPIIYEDPDGEWVKITIKKFYRDKYGALQPKKWYHLFKKTVHKDIHIQIHNLKIYNRP